MDSEIGIGQLNASNEEFVESKFDLFSKVEYETGIIKIVIQTFRPISIYSFFQMIQKSLQIIKVYDCIKKWELERNMVISL